MIYSRQRRPEFWNSVLNNTKYADLIRNIKTGYEETCDTALEPLLVSKYNLYNETGDRAIYEKDYFARRKLLTRAMVLSLLYPEDKKYLEKLEAVMWAVCDEFNWVLPAHNSTHKIDLCSSETGLLLVEAIAFLNERIDCKLKDRVAVEVKNRVIDVYESNEFVWEKYTSNWTAVCTGCVAITMMYAFPEALERSMSRIEKAGEVFLSGFSDEGVCFEGPTYWSYGFGNYVYLADALYEYTNGSVNLFAQEKTKKVAEYPKYSVLCGGSAVSFSDSSRFARFTKGLINCLAKNYNNESFIADEYMIYSLPQGNFQNALIRTFLFDDDASVSLSEKQNYFLPTAAQMIFNKNKYSFAVKGGNNAELHNHNDVGSFIFSDSNGQALCDLGAGFYSKDYFSDKRYNILCTSSLGHNVPIINGKSQSAGKEYFGKLFVEDNKAIVDFASAYDLENIQLKRTVTANNYGVVLSDEFGGETQSFVSRFVTLRKPTVVNTTVFLGKTKIVFDNNVTLNIENTTHKNSLGVDEPVWLLDFSVNDLSYGVCRIEIKVIN